MHDLGAHVSGGSRNFPKEKVLLFLNFFAENCMKMKEFGPPGGHASLAPPLDTPMHVPAGGLQDMI